MKVLNGNIKQEDKLKEEKGVVINVILFLAFFSNVLTTIITFFVGHELLNAKKKKKEICYQP